MRVQMQLSNKSNLVLYLDKETIRKSKDLGFNLSRTFENHLKQLITQFSQLKTENTVDPKNSISGKWAEPELNRRPLARKANVLTRLDDRPFFCLPFIRTVYFFLSLPVSTFGYKYKLVFVNMEPNLQITVTLHVKLES